jgi:hypothetical protein
MKVYRIEDKNGIGPYSIYWEWQDVNHFIKINRHPFPIDEGIMINSLQIAYGIDKPVCGFNSLDQLKDWFSNDEITKLFGLGYYIFFYEIEEEFIFQGKRQLVFIRNNLERRIIC